MKYLNKSSPNLETLVQAILYRSIRENRTTDEIIDSLPESTWLELDIAAERLDANAMVRYIANSESSTMTTDAEVIARTEKREIHTLKIWAIKNIVRTLLTILIGLTIYLAYSSPESISGVILKLVGVMLKTFGI